VDSCHRLDYGHFAAGAVARCRRHRIDRERDRGSSYVNSAVRISCNTTRTGAYRYNLCRRNAIGGAFYTLDVQKEIFLKHNGFHSWVLKVFLFVYFVPIYYANVTLFYRYTRRPIPRFNEYFVYNPFKHFFS
jgi:hypothetical protein